LKNIFVGNLDFTTGQDELRQLFAQCGQVDRVTIMTDRDTRPLSWVWIRRDGEP
jgi:RNA recognition motif-containing protein